MKFLFFVVIFFVVLSSYVFAYECFNLDKDVLIVQTDTRLKLEHVCEDVLNYRIEDKFGYFGDSFSLSKGDSIFVDLFFDVDISYVFDDLVIDNGREMVNIPMLVLSDKELDFDLSAIYSSSLEVKLFNFGESGEFIVNYFIYNENENLIYETSDSVFIDNQKLLRRTFKLENGKYFIVVEMIKNGKNKASAVFVDLNENKYYDSNILYTLLVFLAFILLFWFVLRRPKLLKELNNRHNKELKELYLKKKNKLLENERKELSLLKKYVEMLYNKKLKKSEIKRLCLKKFSKELVGKYFK